MDDAVHSGDFLLAGKVLSKIFARLTKKRSADLNFEHYFF